MELSLARRSQLGTVIFLYLAQPAAADTHLLNCQMGACTWAEVISKNTMSLPDDVQHLTVLDVRIRRFTTGHQDDYPIFFSEDFAIFDDETVGVRVACSTSTPGLFLENGSLTTLGVIEPYGYEQSATSLYFLLCHGATVSSFTPDDLASLGYVADVRQEFQSLDEVLLANSSRSYEIELPYYHRVVDVASNDVLNIRSEPDANAAIVGGFAPDTDLVETTETSPDGRWFRVNNGEVSGWVRNRFLASKRVAVFENTSVPVGLRCMSEEPFDEIRFSLGTVRMRYQNRPEEKELRLNEVVQLPDEAGANVYRLATSDAGTAIDFELQETACSSSMTDQNFPFELSVEYDGEKQAYFGCCTLTD